MIGAGQAGCNITAEIADLPNATDYLDFYLVNSTLRDMVHIDQIPRDQWIGVNEQDGLILLEGREGEEDRVSGGMGKDPRRCYETLSDKFADVASTLEDAKVGDRSITDERFAVIVFSGGGGTGAGAAPVLAHALREITDQTCRVLGVMVLPVSSRGDELETGSQREAWNAWFSLERSMDAFDGLILVDNDRLSHLGDIERGFPTFNEYIARCLTDLILGNLTELAVPDTDEEVVVQQSDVQDLITAMSLGQPGERQPGVATMGRAVQLLRSPVGYLLPVFSPGQPDLLSLARLARERLTLDETPMDGHEKSFVLVRAPSDVLGRAGTGQEVSEVISLLSQASHRDETLYGTAITERPIASVTMGITFDPKELPRLEELEGEAMQYEWGVAEPEAG